MHACVHDVLWCMNSFRRERRRSRWSSASTGQPLYLPQSSWLVSSPPPLHQPDADDSLYLSLFFKSKLSIYLSVYSYHDLSFSRFPKAVHLYLSPSIYLSSGYFSGSLCHIRLFILKLESCAVVSCFSCNKRKLP